MRLCTIRTEQQSEQAAVVTTQGIVPVAAINAHLGKAWPVNVYDIIVQGLSTELLRDARATPVKLAADTVQFGPLYRHPRKILGIGLNYRDHAADLDAPYPTEPASFMKCDNTIIGPGDVIELPSQSQRVTAEAEIGVIIGKTCRRVTEDKAQSYIAGYCLIIDMTAEDILQQNPRFLTRSKNFDTFFSFGPELITTDEVTDLLGLKVGTWKNNTLHRENVVSNMAFPPLCLVAFHSHVATLFPGDIISTGTPGAVVIEDGDVAQCRISGLGELCNPVRRRDQ
ncbi:MAG: fumarylacetoacetate hydrolase family protein [Betaproteobacteria bacterium]|jgi:2-keto-4-pentenoate hydratase/2-oxohepta-3-ene-1,7-dioic acid hydratase in catechol pathway|nr:MAG: fumarylacetoacetate hydrolase family protein [Betaproteobacteria bacterium]